jgi:hypothetical protein
MENLPVEMHTEIFSYLDRQSLNTSTQVCKKWRSIVHGSSALMRNRKLRVHNFKKQKKFIKNSGRSFKTVCIKNKEFANKSCTRAELLKILRGVANVKSLKVSGDFLGFSERKVANLELNNLKELTLNGSANSSRISKILKNVKLQKLTMNIHEDWGKFDKHFQSWLIKQDRLEDLYIKNTAMKIFFNEFPAEKLKFQLKKLTIKEECCMHRKKEAHFKRNFFNFLRSQRNLEEVVTWSNNFVFWSGRFWPETLAQLLTSKVLKKLKIIGNALPAMDSSADNESLECLSVSFDYHWIWSNTVDPNWPTLNILRKLKHLDLSFPLSEVRDIIPNCSRLNQLTTLKLTKSGVYGRESDAFRYINFPDLKEIDLSNMHLSHGDWIRITTKCPLVEKITLYRFIMDEESANLICETWKNLKEIDLGVGFYPENIFPAVLKSSSLKELKVLEKMKQQLEEHLNRVEIPFKITVMTRELEDEYWDRFSIPGDLLEGRDTYLDNNPDVDDDSW